MKHLIGRLYYKKPCLIGIRVNSRRAAIVLNVVASVITTAAIISLIIWRVS